MELQDVPLKFLSRLDLNLRFDSKTKKKRTYSTMETLDQEENCQNGDKLKLKL